MTPTPRGVPTYDSTKFSQKLHEIERIWTRSDGSKILGSPRSNFLHFRAIFKKIWPNNMLPPLPGKPGSATERDWTDSSFRLIPVLRLDGETLDDSSPRHGRLLGGVRAKLILHETRELHVQRQQIHHEPRTQGWTGNSWFKATGSDVRTDVTFWYAPTFQYT